MVAVRVGVAKRFSAEDAQYPLDRDRIAGFLHDLADDRIDRRLARLDRAGRQAPAFATCFLLQEDPAIGIDNDGRH
ncbi:hypothetical protein ASE71_25310 [Ensifer sp. Root954]|nr:hypothetical protein ASD49_26945 [Ensifer sp. Root1298]KQX90146.1 hypothetical protein ASD41_25630 [Ensifer sp. Root1312]KRC25285.1 hypothetical protein ASE29_24085 [Ensifer sp. Root74]KRD67206.1 hypothetical protein ASE71_25310 [Ensifer sp. Root954]